MADKKTPVTIPAWIGKKIYLRQLTAEDVVSIQTWRLQSDLTALSCRPIVITSPAEAAERYKKAEPSLDHQRLAILRKEDNVLVGSVAFFDLNWLNRSAELGVVVDPDERRKGHAAEAIRLVAGYLFRFRGLNKVHAQTAAYNKATIKLLEKLNFKRDAVLRAHYFHDGQYYDGLIYSLLSFEVD